MKTNRELVQSLINKGVLQSKNIIESFLKVNRRDFVIEEEKDFAYIDNPLPIWYSQTISQPSTVAFMLELLKPKKWDHILDIWSGSWWTTMLLWYIVWDEGSVIWLERIDDLVEFWSDNIKKYNFKNVTIKKARKTLWIPWKQFDKILVSAAATELPHELIWQLYTWWILIIPINESVCKIIKISENKHSLEEYFGFAFVPLVQEK